MRALLAGAPTSLHMEKRYLCKNGQILWAMVTTSLLRDADGAPLYFITQIQDITARKQAEEKLRRANRALKVLSECNQALVRASDESELLREICRIIVEHGDYRLAWVGFAEQDADKTVRPVAQAGYEEGYLETLKITWADAERGRGPTGTAVRTGQPCVAKSLLTEPTYAPWRDEALKRGYASSVAFPLIRNGQSFGALNIYAAEPDAFDANEVNLLIELANDLAYGILSLRTRLERQRAEEALKRLNETLEQRVAQRTAELRRIVNAMTGREVRMAELKSVIQKLRAQLHAAGLQPVADDPLRREDVERKA